MFEFPKISIVTPSYNQADYLEETILSVINQNYPNLEYIIIDGGSTDGSISIIQKYAYALKYWVSEPDHGQVDAINKGIKYCTGEIFNWINSDDYLEPNALFAVAANWQKGYCVCGKVRNFFQNSVEDGGVHPNRIESLAEFIALKSKYHQPGFWFDLSLLQKVIPIQLKSHYYFDKILMIDFLHTNPLKIITIKDVLVNFRVHDNSKTVLIQKNAYFELINHYQELLMDSSFSSYHSLIKHTIAYNLKPKLLIDQWRDFKKPGLTKKLAYFIMGLKNPVLFKSRLYYTILKNEVI